MATIPKLMTPRQIERGIRYPQPLVLFCARLAARSVADAVKRGKGASGSMTNEDRASRRHRAKRGSGRIANESRDRGTSGRNKEREKQARFRESDASAGSTQRALSRGQWARQRGSDPSFQ